MKKRVLILFSICLLLTFLQPTHIETQQGIIPIIMAAIAAASTAYGAVKSGQANRKNERMLGELKDENQADYVREYNRGALDNPGSKAYLKRLQSTMEDNTKATENTAAATGATQENVLNAKQSNNRVMSDAISGLVEREDVRQENVKDRYLQRKSGLVSGQMGLNSQRAQTWADTAQGISSAAGSLASAYMLSGANNTGNPLDPSAGDKLRGLFNR